MAPFGLALFGDSGDASLPDRIEPCAKGNDAAFEKFIDGALVRIYNESSARTADGKALRASCKPLLGAPHSHRRGAIPEAWSKPRPGCQRREGVRFNIVLENHRILLAEPSDLRLRPAWDATGVSEPPFVPTSALRLPFVAVEAVACTASGSPGWWTCRSRASLCIG